MNSRHIQLPEDLAHLREAHGDTVSPANPETFVDQAVQAATRILRQGEPSDANDFRLAMGGEIPIDEPAAEPEAEPTAPQAVDRAGIADVPEPEQPQEDYISTEDEEKFITYLRDAYKFAQREQRQELQKAQTDRLYVQYLTQLLHLVDQLEDTYGRPGVVSMNQHIENTRKLERYLEQTLDAKSQEPEPEPEPVSAPEPVAAEPQSEVSPVAPTDKAPSPVEPGDPQAVGRNAGKFTSSRSAEMLDDLADLIYRTSFNLASDEDKQRVADLKANNINDFRAGRRRWSRLKNRLNTLSSLVQSGADVPPERQQELQDLRQRFPAALTESLFAGDPVLRVLFEAEVSAPRMELLGRSDEWLRVWPEPDRRDFYYDLFTTGGWPPTGIVQTAAPVAPAEPVEPEAPPTAWPATAEDEDVIAPEPEQAAEPEAEVPEELDTDERRIVKDIEAVVKKYESGRYDAHALTDDAYEVWQKLATNLSLQHKQPDLKKKLRAALRGVESAKNIVDLADPTRLRSAVDRVQFAKKILQNATQYRTGFAWWTFGLGRTLKKLRAAGDFQATKTRENKNGTEYAIRSPSFSKRLFFWVPKEEQAESVLNLSQDLRDILAEQEMDVSRDPKGEAPVDAFGVPPLPPGIDPEGGAGEEGAPALPGDEPSREQDDKPLVPVRVIVTQNNKWWEMAWENWIQFLIQGASGSRWNLDHWGARNPEGKPADVRDFISQDTGPQKYYSTEESTNIYYVKNWSPDRFRKELDYVQAMDVAGLTLVEPKPPAEEPTILSTR